MIVGSIIASTTEDLRYILNGLKSLNALQLHV